MRTIRRTLIAAGAIAAIAAAVCAPMALADDGYDKSDGRGPGGGPDALSSIALTSDNTLIRFGTDDPGGATEIGEVSGLLLDSGLVGIDFRVQDGLLYGVGDRGGIYTIDENTAAATLVRQLTVALEGDFFGVDFNPAANALRIISDTGQNLRQPFAMALAPTAVDTPLTNPAPPPGTGRVPATGVTGAAYTNNDTDDGTDTELFVIDTDNDRLSIQSPANAGTLTPQGDLGLKTGPAVAFDIFSTLSDGVATSNTAFAALDTGYRSSLVSIDLSTGTATEIGDFDATVLGLAVELDG